MATGYDNIGKGGIVKEGIFVRFPDLIPACNERWWNDNLWHSRLLIVGESSYFSDDTPSVFKNPDLWYKGKDTKHLIPPSDDPENPQKYSNLVSNWKAGYPPFDRLRDSMNAVSNDIHCDCIYDEAMFYNYFLRPATVKVVRGKRILTFKKDCTQIDRDVAGDALCGIIETVKPDIVIFISRYAYSEFNKYIVQKEYNLNIPLDFVNHPSHPAGWWNYKTGNGIQKFERLLREYWIKK